MGVRNGGQEAREGSEDDHAQVRRHMLPYSHHMDGGVKISAFGGTCRAAHASVHVSAMPQRIAMVACDMSITFSHYDLHATCNHYMSHAIHIADMLCVCVRAQNDF